jgi:hypothetical protein
MAMKGGGANKERWTLVDRRIFAKATEGEGVHDVFGLLLTDTAAFIHSTLKETADEITVVPVVQ